MLQNFVHQAIAKTSEYLNIFRTVIFTVHLCLAALIFNPHIRKIC